MVKIEKTINLTKCDVCGDEKSVYRVCAICGKDICQNCVVELYIKKPTEPEPERRFPYDPLSLRFDLYREDHQYVDSMCKACYDLFKQVVKKRVTI